MRRPYCRRRKHLPTKEISFEQAWDRVCIEINKKGTLSWFIDPFGYNDKKNIDAYRIHTNHGFSHVSNIERKTK